MFEGILLACWLALQEGVDAVSFEAESAKYVLEKGSFGVAKALQNLLQDFELKKQPGGVDRIVHSRSLERAS